MKVGDDIISFHQCVLVRSKLLQKFFKNRHRVTLTNLRVFRDVEVAEVKILMQVMYGVHNPILGHSTYKGGDYFKAMWLAEMLGCDACVYDTVVLCARAHFSAFKNWPFIPANSMTQDLHRAKFVEINEAFAAYKDVLGCGAPRAFLDNSFAVLLAQFCPDSVYCMYNDILDGDLVRQVSVAMTRMRSRAYPFSAEELKLVTCPRI
ncbi:hypothetical protein F5Y08DRAFT_134701 [Xylaria arbuscula]|nr:hypothetical protein F5Y08DRAFT_134701 [Xylaria arbuscula]